MQARARPPGDSGAPASAPVTQRCGAHGVGATTVLQSPVAAVTSEAPFHGAASCLSRACTSPVSRQPWMSCSATRCVAARRATEMGSHSIARESTFCALPRRPCAEPPRPQVLEPFCDDEPYKASSDDVRAWTALADVLHVVPCPAHPAGGADTPDCVLRCACRASTAPDGHQDGGCAPPGARK